MHALARLAQIHWFDEDKSQHDMGERVINNRTVRLTLVAQVVDPRAEPCRSHASDNYQNTGTGERLEDMVEPKSKRKNAKRTRASNGLGSMLYNQGKTVVIAACSTNIR